MTEAAEREVEKASIADVVYYVKQLQAHTEQTGEDMTLECAAALMVAESAKCDTARDVGAALVLADMLCQGAITCLQGGGGGLSERDYHLLRKLLLDVVQAVPPSMMAGEPKLTMH